MLGLTIWTAVDRASSFPNRSNPFVIGLYLSFTLRGFQRFSLARPALKKEEPGLRTTNRDSPVRQFDMNRPLLPRVVTD